MKNMLVLASCALLLGACGQSGSDGGEDGNGAANTDAATAGDAAGSASAAPGALRTAAGADAGTVTASRSGNTLTLRVDARGLPAGAHGMHLHENARCEGPKFTSAGSHWNPADKKHGHRNPEGPHAGDLGNLQVTPNGQGSGIGTVDVSTTAFPEEGLALLIHAKADDEQTDPSGDSGDRIACAIVTPPPADAP